MVFVLASSRQHLAAPHVGHLTVLNNPRRKPCISPKSLFKRKRAIKTAHNAMAAVECEDVAARLHGY
jgi:hypothetical protein